MVFNSIPFLVFVLLFFHLYWWINNKASVHWRNIYLIIASYIFYGWWDWRFLGLIIISSIVDFVIGLRMTSTKTTAKKKQLLIISLVVNLGILGFFKYFNFFVHSFQLMLSQLGIETQTTTLNIILPVGISFYTFQTMSYSLDIYRGQLEPTKSWTRFFAFVSFFPQLVAGPIERASRFLPQFKQRKKFDYNQAVAGLRLMLWGFFKKIVIADNLAPLVDEIFDAPGAFPGAGILLGAVAFAFQVYCDFSGYSDIAIGLSKTMGFELMTNFKKPYFSKSFGEFWGRWHISLSTWFRDYVYIPLGGNRVSKSRNNLNLMITFVISGLWHGANFTFIIWGFLHGAMLILEKRIRFLKHLPTAIIFLITSLFWIPFRAKGFSHLKTLALSLFNWNTSVNWESLVIYPPSKTMALGIILVSFVIAEKLMRNNNFTDAIKTKSRLVRITTYLVLAFSILLLGNFDVKPNFIYFQF